MLKTRVLLQHDTLPMIQCRLLDRDHFTFSQVNIDILCTLHYTADSNHLSLSLKDSRLTNTYRTLIFFQHCTFRSCNVNVMKIFYTFREERRGEDMRGKRYYLHYLPYLCTQRWNQSRTDTYLYTSINCTSLSRIYIYIHRKLGYQENQQAEHLPLVLNSTQFFFSLSLFYVSNGRIWDITLTYIVQ